MYIFSDPDGSIIAAKDIQMCSYFSFFAALPSTSSLLDVDMWSEEEILDNNFIQTLAQSLVPDGIRVKTYFRNLRTNEIGGVSTAEYQVVLFGERLPITTKDAQIYHDLIHDEVQRRTVGTRKSLWPPSNPVPSSLVSAYYDET